MKNNSKFKAGDKVIITKSKFRGASRQVGCIVTLVKYEKVGNFGERYWVFKDDKSSDWIIEEDCIAPLTKLEKLLL